ncbi:MAG: substrate-binding domain-containing protein [Alphaproteobacteria bacterium]
MKSHDVSRTIRTGLAGAALAVLAVPGAASAQETLKVYVSAGFDGNTWMDASMNLLRAISQTSAYKDRVELEVQSARGDAQVQQQQINAMVQAGADIIVAWPISPTALNRSVRNACSQGVIFITWDAQVTEPCAYYVGINQDWAGAGPAEWLAQELDGEGDIIFMGGIPGTMVDTRRNEAAKAVFAEYPGIEIVADTPSMWNNATARQKLAEIVAARGWDSIDGLWTQTGCYEFAQLQIEAGRDTLLPCAGNGSNGERVSQLPEGATEGALAVPGVSMGSPPWAAPYAFKLAMEMIDGGEVQKYTEIPMPLVKSEDTVLCESADRDELVAMDWSCNAVPLSVAPANYFIDVWSKEVPELDLYSALNGTVPEGQ